MATKEQKKIRKQWVAALRSGQYKQGIGALVTLGDKYDRFCCLGVLCDMAVRAGVIESPIVIGLEENLAYGLDLATGALPQEVVDWVGINTCAGDFEGSDLAWLNDKGKKFKTIAKIIESEPEG